MGSITCRKQLGNTRWDIRINRCKSDSSAGVSRKRASYINLKYLKDQISIIQESTVYVWLIDRARPGYLQPATT